MQFAQFARLALSKHPLGTLRALAATQASFRLSAVQMFVALVLPVHHLLGEQQVARTVMEGPFRTPQVLRLVPTAQSALILPPPPQLL